MRRKSLCPQNGAARETKNFTASVQGWLGQKFRDTLCVIRGYHVNALNASPFYIVVQKRKKFTQQCSGKSINANKGFASDEILKHRHCSLLGNGISRTTTRWLAANAACSQRQTALEAPLSFRHHSSRRFTCARGMDFTDFCRLCTCTMSAHSVGTKVR